MQTPQCRKSAPRGFPLAFRAKHPRMKKGDKKHIADKHSVKKDLKRKDGHKSEGTSAPLLLRSFIPLRSIQDDRG